MQGFKSRSEFGETRHFSVPAVWWNRNPLDFFGKSIWISKKSKNYKTEFRCFQADFGAFRLNFGVYSLISPKIRWKTKNTVFKFKIPSWAGLGEFQWKLVQISFSVYYEVYIFVVVAWHGIYRVIQWDGDELTSDCLTSLIESFWYGGSLLWQNLPSY